MKPLMALILVLLSLSCAPANEELPPSPSPSLENETSPRDRTIDEQRRLETLYEELQIAHQQSRDVWETLSEGRNVPCTTRIQAPDPQAFSGEGIYTDMRFAALEFNRLAQLWAQECANPRGQVPQQTINEALLSLSNAASRMDEIETALHD